MILIENRNYLRFHNRKLLQRLAEADESSTDNHLSAETSRMGIPTLKVIVDGSFQYVHSKYDPEREADRLVGGLPDIGSYDQVLFIGSGLGYVIQKFTAAYPDKKFSIYEPDSQVLLQLLSFQNLNDWSDHLLLLTDSESELKTHIRNCFDQKGERFYFFVLPFYEKIYHERVDQLLNGLKELLKEKKDSVATDLAFQKRWIINAVKNFPALLETPNVLDDMSPEIFQNKPAIIVSAGPSLNDEWKSLKYIKENGFAYIFAVGSAINALIKHEIYPDAVCSYDPQAHNYQVIKIIKEQGLKTIPLIFGSTVGFETLEGYEGPLLHMIVSQDSIAPQFLRKDDSSLIGTIHDAPSIALVTFEMLCRLGAGPVIFVGQNLAYLNNEFYAAGISYENRPTVLTETDLQNELTVKSVSGEMIKTNEGFEKMRKQLEQYILAFPQTVVINATKGGAEIKGTTYKPLDQVISEKLLHKVVEPDWFKGMVNHYNKTRTAARVQEMVKNETDFNHYTKQLIDILSHIQTAVEKNSEKLMQREIDKVEKVLHKLQRNKYFINFIAPMMRVQNEHVKQASRGIKFESNLTEKSKMILQEIGLYATECAGNENIIGPYFSELKNKVNQTCGNRSEKNDR